MPTITSNIVQFPAGAARKPAPDPLFALTEQGEAALDRAPRSNVRRGKFAKCASTDTAVNSRLRSERYRAWLRALCATRYWRARIDYEEAVYWAQRSEIAEGNLQPALFYQRGDLTQTWRKALVAQMLTPAWDSNSLKWKKAMLLKGEHRHIGANEARIKQAIADDETWLAAHPTRRSNPGKTAERRAFREAMRQRIRDIAASRGLAEADIRRALRLKHQAIGEFAKAHNVSLAWLIEGTGPAYMAWPAAERQP